MISELIKDEFGEEKDDYIKHLSEELKDPEFKQMWLESREKHHELMEKIALEIDSMNNKKVV